MPRLLVFAACDSVLIDGDDNSASLISLLEGVEIGIEGEIPADARYPMKWCVFSLWRKYDGEEGKTFEQNIQIVSPAGNVGKDNIVPFLIDKKNHRVKMTVHSLPIGEFGEWQVNLLIREAGSTEWSQAASYPISITRAEVKSEQPETEAAETK